MSYKQFSRLINIDGIDTWASLVIEKDESGNIINNPVITFDKEVSPTQEQLDALYEEISGEKPVSLDEKRRQAYRDESDPLFFKWQRGEATMEEWLAKIAEIKGRYKE